MTIDAKARSLLLVCAIALPCLVFANHGQMVLPKQTIAASTQQNGVRGKVVDKAGEPLIGVTITEVGTANKTISDADGNFTLTLSKKNNRITLSYVGFTDQTVVATDGMIVTLQPQETELSEVVVVGYGTQRKESLTGAMANIKSEKLKDITSASVENMLNGKAAGVYVAPGSGQPGTSGAIVIRGQTSINGATAPLWVIDGIIVGNSPGELNPADIESLTVLKDAASTAIYGSEGANGVIVVTTKKAKSGRTAFNITAKTGISTLSRGHMQMMDGAEFYDFYKSFANVDQVKFKRWTPDLRNQNFDWFKLATQTGFTQDYNLTVSGGDDKLKSFFSLGYYNEEGAVKGYDYDRYSARMSLSYQPAGWLSITPSFSGSLRNVSDKQHDVGSMFYMMPWDSPYDEQGNLVPNQYSGWVNSKGTNYLYDLQWNHNEEKQYEVVGGLDFKVDFTDWLSFTSSNNYRYSNLENHGYYDPRSSAAGGDTHGRITEWRESWVRRYSSQILRFEKIFEAHRVSGMLAYEFNDYEHNYIDAYGTGFVKGFEALSATSKPEKLKGAPSAWAKQSLFTQWKYSYDDKLFAELSLRRDGRSNFGINNRYGNFFSVSGAWSINREKWFTLECVDLLKLRASYGSVGNVPIELYPSYSLYSVGVNYDSMPGALISQIGNPNLTWEKTFTSGIGVDLSLFKNRIRLTLDGYVKNTSNILYKVPVTGLTGVTSIWKNIGKMRNTGVELTLGGDIIRTKDLTWSVDLNLTHNANELRDLYKQLDNNGNYIVKPVLISDGTTIAGTAQRILEIGEPVDTYYMKEWAGVNKEDGRPMWYTTDKNGNKVTTSNYAKASDFKCGKASPDLFGSISTALSYKNFDLHANFGYSIGGQIYSYYRQEFDSDGAYAGDRNQMKLQSGWTRWQKPNDEATHPRALYNNQDKGNQASSRYLESSDYLKLRSLTLGYNVDLNRFGIKNMRISLTGENLFTITNYSGVDPELPAGTNDKGVLSVMNTGGTYVYPMVRKFMLGLNLTF